MTTRQYQASRPINSRRGTAVVAKSPIGNRHLYPSITSFVRDVESLSLSDRRTASRRVAQGGGYVGSWYVSELPQS